MGGHPIARADPFMKWLVFASNFGEVHHWMYDDYSLKRLLEGNGFSSIVRRTAVESYIKGWESFNLDTEPDGAIYKLYSLYIEAIIEK
jgi:hypothetical protein